jgi:hypothetical protein
MKAKGNDMSVSGEWVEETAEYLSSIVECQWIIFTTEKI